MTLLSRDEIFKIDDRKYEVVDVPEWGGSVRLRSMTGKERDAFEQSTVQMKGGKQKQNLENFRARLVAKCAVDENGNLLFSNAADVRELGEKSVAALQRLFNAAQRMNGLSDEDVEEMTEDFDGAETEAEVSISASPSPSDGGPSNGAWSESPPVN